MKTTKQIQWLMIAGLCWIVAGCGAISMQQGGLNSQYDISQLQSRIKKNPKDFQALRDLGVASYERDQFKQARKYLIRAFKLNPSDPQTMLYLGMALEAEKLPKLAQRIYKRYHKIPAKSEYRSLIQARYELLSRDMAKQDIKTAMSNEEAIGAKQLSPNAIAVLPLKKTSGPDEYAPLGTGIAEMIITDLAQVPELKLIERVRVSALMEEMALGQSGMIDVSTAPRMGQLVSAGRIVNGTYTIGADEHVNIDASFWDVMKQQQPAVNSKSDALQNIFVLEKDLVFNMIDDMGITLTPEQHAKIQYIPTKNLQAFLAYSMGLELEDAGQFEAAAKEFENAVKMDPQFKKASARAHANQSMAVMQGPKPNLAKFADSFERGDISRAAGPDGITAPSFNLMEQRLQNLSLNLGSNFIPGQDTRKPTEEAGATIYNALPLPPNPPPIPTPTR
jgi:tetratricopeptide (TPR) repeat protein